MYYEAFTRLKNEIQNLGFDLKEAELEDTLLERANFFQISITIPNPDASKKGDYFSVFFMGTLPGQEERGLIRDLFAAILIEKPNGTKQPIITTSYHRNQGPLPAKDQILKKFSEALRIKNVQEKFGNEENQTSLQNRKKNKL